MASSQQTVTVAGRRLKLTNLDKVLYPAEQTTKAEVIEYLQTVAPAILPHIRGRAVTRKRWPNGVGSQDRPKDAFFRKNLEDSAPVWVPRLGLQHADHVNVYPLAEDEAVLAWFGQVAALELHVPQWRFDAGIAPFVPRDSKQDTPQVAEPANPDRLVLDLDPGPGANLTDCAQVALWCREILEDMGLTSVPVTSGSKGIHLYAALDGVYTSEQVSQVAKELAHALATDHPKKVISQMKRAARRDKVFIDWSQNNANKTTVAPYSLRGRLQPWVAAPRTWDEMKDPDLGQLDFREVMQRLAEGNDPLSGFGGPAEDDALTTYRSMRDANKTSEPVPSDSPAARTGDPIFVIQEHHASSLHYDTRLERHGVLVSWAVPKGPPLQTGQQRLAVMTEDHPIEYAQFEGVIPAKEYGGGEVTIWDTGTVEIEKWELDEDKQGKIVFVLHGQPEGGLGGRPRRYALIQTDDRGKDWLIRMTKDQPPAGAAPGPEFPAAMLATLGSPADIRGSDWALEAKWDGYRVLARVETDGVRLRSRNGKDLTETFPELQELKDLADPGTVLDGEVVALNSGHRPDFGRLQQRGRLTTQREISRAAERHPVHYMVFDILHCAEHGQTIQLPYRRRREILLGSVTPGDHIQVPGDLGGVLEEALEISQELTLEGLIAKHCQSRYLPGQRTDDWVKIKHANHVDVVVIGWRQGKGGRAKTFGSLLLAMTDDDGELSYAGRVGTGFSDADLTQLRTRLERLVRKTPPVHDIPEAEAGDATWVTPSLAAEVKHSGITRDRRLRHPVWRTVADRS